MSNLDHNDPTRIKALAHPVRLKLLEFLASVPQATATQCAEAIGESVASCSFHLRSLATHGYIEPAPSHDSKSKPWRVAEKTRLNKFDDDAPESLPAISALGTAVVAQVTERLSEVVAALPILPSETIQRTMLANFVLWLTDEEHSELMDKFMELCAPYTDRGGDEAARPDNAALTHLFLAATPDLVKVRSK